MSTRRLVFVVLANAATTLGAQVRVNPTGVSVSSMSATTVFLTYGGLRNERPVDAILVRRADCRGTRHRHAL